MCQKNRSLALKTLFLRWVELASLDRREIFPELNITSTKSENLVLRFVLNIQKILFHKFRSSRTRSMTQKVLFPG